MPKSLKNVFSADKPWACLRMTRKQYEQQRIWKKLNMPRAEFDALVLKLPSEVVEGMYDEARADMLVESIFKGQTEAEK